MAITSGFWDSFNGDRMYSAEAFGQLFEGLISDGIAQSEGNALAYDVSQAGTAVGAPKIGVKSGKAWFNNHYIRNDATTYITLDNPQSLYSGTVDPQNSYYAKALVYLYVDTTESGGVIYNTYENVRTSTTGRICGLGVSYVPSSTTGYDNIQTPTATGSTGIYTYPLYLITYNDSEQQIAQGNILRDYRGTASCPWIQLLIEGEVGNALNTYY